MNKAWLLFFFKTKETCQRSKPYIYIKTKDTKTEGGQTTKPSEKLTKSKIM